jgi:ribonucleoside-diphosphate reductase alpha chain
MTAGLWLPGGRIFAGAGTEKRVTLMNCYVNEKIDDSMEGIMHALSNTALTLQQGGGIGTDFSTLRPEGALLTRTHTKASGPIPFMHTWDATSRTIRSAGDRRGAMMGTMCDTHPDLLKFIRVKQTKGSLEQFNISILVSDALMEAVKDDAEWLLYFPVRPMQREAILEQYDFEDDNNVKQYVYRIVRARELWEEITRATYEYSEPGVIFVDRINEANNLWYCEDIRCTNPCGEQPLPPHGTCNLGHVNLARVVKNPFSEDAWIDFDLVKETTQIGVRFLDAVIDASAYPLTAQEHEERTKRRLGLGFTGLADMLAQLRVRYGSREAIKLTEEVTRVISWTAYETSVELAKEKGPFEVYQPEYLTGHNFAATMLPEYIKDAIRTHGIRNSLLLTVAPTGTGSIFYGNVSSGGEPVFLHSTQRRVLKPTDGFKDEWETYVEWGYGARLYHSIFGADKDLPSYMVTAEDLTVEEHVTMQAAAQRWIDASMSKTINVPKDYPYEQFAKVYELAYSLGCKGCTTYRPSDVRGSVLSKPGESVSEPSGASTQILAQRPDVLRGATYKIKWPSLQSALYLTINEDASGVPFEIFIASKDSRYHDWTTGLTTMISAIFRKGGDTSFVANELQQVQALNDSAFREGKNHPSLLAYIGYKLEQHIAGNQQVAEPTTTTAPSNAVGDKCPQCHQFTLTRQEGCKKCPCGFSSCG